MTTPHQTLPALKSLGKLASARPTIIIDTREQAPLQFTRLEAVTGKLMSGDYSVRGVEHLFAVERKSVDDLVGCCMGDNRERFMREMHRLRGFRFARLLIVGTREEIAAGGYRSKLSPKVVLNSLSAWEARFNIPAIFAPTPTEAASLIERWSWWFAREIVEQANDLRRGTA